MAELETWMLANMGEISYWLTQDQVAAARFAAWYNKASEQLDIPKPQATAAAVQCTAQQMFESLSLEVGIRG